MPDLQVPVESRDTVAANTGINRMKDMEHDASEYPIASYPQDLRAHEAAATVALKGRPGPRRKGDDPLDYGS